jgi:nucleotide-binding universal stress UspA family protein
MALHDRIVLATDLSARSDRALDRATMLARRDGAELTVIHVLEPSPINRYYPRTRPLPDLAAIARAHLTHDLGPCATKSTVRIEEGDPAESIERVAREQSATLVVVGVARTERLGRFVLGNTVERLVRGLDVPLLIVTDRPRGPYARIAVAVDFSQVSHQILELATTAFPEQRITVFHAYKPLASYGASNLELHREQFREIAESDYAKWLARASLSAETRSRIDARIEFGEPAALLREAAGQGGFDLVVVGTRGRGPVFEFFIGSVGKRILAELPTDALFVRESR